MLVGFYRAGAGEIYIDGQRISDSSLRSLRSQVGLVAQEVLIFPGTIRENIKLGNRKATDEEIETRLSEVIVRDREPIGVLKRYRQLVSNGAEGAYLE